MLPLRPFKQKHEFMSLREITQRPFPILERPKHLQWLGMVNEEVRVCSYDHAC